MQTTVLNYGGGRQTVAICLLIAKGVIAKPDHIVMADTSRENPMTFEYLEEHMRPLMREHGLEIEVAPHSFSTIDLYANNGDLLLPVFTTEGKLPGYCSSHWKTRVVSRYMKATHGVSKGMKLVGYSYDEQRRWKKSIDQEQEGWTVGCPLVDLMLTTHDCHLLIKKHGLPVPHRSACWMCPHKSNEEWKVIRDNYPSEWDKACELDEEIRENDDRGGVFLHHSRVPLRVADLSVEEKPEMMRQCSLGMCFV